MKANEAPEKLYLHPTVKGNVGASWLTFPLTNEDVEYVRKDAFIERAAKWIEEINNHHHIMRYSDSCEPPLSELTEWFRNYIKGE